MDKKRIGAIVGAVGVAGAIAASYFMQVDNSQAEFVTKDLAEKYNASLRDAEEIAGTGSEDSKDLTEDVSDEAGSDESIVVYDPVQKVEYIVASPTQEDTSKQSRTLEAREESKAESEDTKQESESKVQDRTEDIVIEGQPTFDLAETRPFIGVVDTDVLNVRADTNTEAEVVTIFQRNDVVRGTVDGDWVALEETGGLIGYVNKNFLKEVTEEEALAQEETNRQEAIKKAEEEKAEAERKAEEERVAAEEKKAAEQKAAEEASKAKAENDRIEAEKKAEADRQAKASAEAEEERKKAQAEEKETSVSGYVRVDSANVRSNAGTDGSILGSVNANYPIEGTKKGHWIRFDYHGQTGYIADYLVGDGEVEISASKTPKTYAKQQAEIEAAKPKTKAGYVNTSANVRKGPGTGYDIIKTLAINTYIEGEESNGWVKYDAGGQDGYIASFLLADSQVEVAEAPESRQEEANEANSYSGGVSGVLEFAYSKLGCAYVYGGEGPDAYDCSGLVQAAYRQAGVRLPHSSRSQYGYGYAVSMENLQKGDLLFYASGSSIDHVAIYVGGGKMIHASTPATGVRTDSIYSPWYQSRFVGARRIFN